MTFDEARSEVRKTFSENFGDIPEGSNLDRMLDVLAESVRINSPILPARTILSSIGKPEFWAIYGIKIKRRYYPPL